MAWNLLRWDSPSLVSWVSGSILCAVACHKLACLCFSSSTGLRPIRLDGDRERYGTSLLQNLPENPLDKFDLL